MNKNKLVNVLLEKFEQRKARVGIVGMGYVGVPLAFHIVDSGFEVIGYDVDENKVRLLNQGKSCFSHIAHKTVSKYTKSNKFIVHGKPDNLSYCDVILICVPTPIGENREPDLSCVELSCQDIAGILRRGQLVVLESSTYPGTTAELVKSILEQNPNDLVLGQDYFLGYSPEREDPGNKNFNVKNTPKVVAGVTPESLELLQAFYSKVVDTIVPVSSTSAAEMVKILENTYRAVNIALVNELKCVCEKLGLNIWEIIEAAKTKPYGYQAFYPSVGVGGHCIAVDPLYLTWRAKQLEIPTRFIELANEVNWEMPRYVVQRIQYALNGQGKAIKNSNILVIGVTYKKNINDIRESAALKVIRDLIKLHGKVTYHDPYAAEIAIWLNASEAIVTLNSVELSSAILEKQDCVVLLTDHDCLDYALINLKAKVIVDTRHRFSSNSSKVVQA